MVTFKLCQTCRDHIVNDDIGDASVEQETATYSGYAVLSRDYHLVYSETSGENWFKCECCGVRCFSEIAIFHGHRKTQRAVTQ